jgi:hypothetical protein
VKTINLLTLLPVCLLVFQAFIFFLGGIYFLKKIRLLKSPYAGMEYSQVIVSAAFLFSVIFIGTASNVGLFHAYKAFQNIGAGMFGNLFSKFSQFFFIVVFFEILFVMLFLICARVVFGFGKLKKELENGNLPGAIIVASATICFAITMQFCAKEAIVSAMPQFIDIR